MTEDSDNSPKLVWTFPLIRIASKRRGILSRIADNRDVGKNVTKARTKVKDKVSETGKKIRSATSKDTSDDDELGDILDDVTELEGTSNSVFGNGSSILVEEIEINEETYLPRTVEIESDHKVVWQNNTSAAKTVAFADGTTIEIEPNESVENSFEQSGEYLFYDPVEGERSMCGAVVVDMSAQDVDLPCSSSADYEPYEDQTQQTSQVSNFSQAAAEKHEDSIKGF